MRNRVSSGLPEWSSILLVGQDQRGRWLVQDIIGRIEGVFTSRENALGFAQAECDIHHATFEMASGPLTPRLLH